MDVIIHEIRQAIDAGFVYVSVAMCLSLPDICVALESDTGETDSAGYIDWCEQWLDEDYDTVLTGKDLWSLRCGVLHQGQFGPKNRVGQKKMSCDRILFMVQPGFHLCRSIQDDIDVFQVDARQFCDDMLDSVRRWYHAKQQDQHVMQNLPRLVQFRPNGLPPHFVGMPMIG